MKVDLNRMYVTDEIKEAVWEVLESGRYVKGPRARELEEIFCEKTGAAHSVSCSSGTSALMLAFKALGIGPGDEVIVPSHTFAATINGFLHYGAVPVFADIDETTYTMSTEGLEELITERTKAIAPVHLYGHPADMDPICRLAEERGLKVVSDACQSHGARYRGRDVGVIGDVTCYSFFPSKIITVAGEGGMNTCSDEKLYLDMKALANHGRYPGERDVHRVPGFNMRLSELLAAVGIIQMEHINEWVNRRREIAAVYDQELEGLGDIVVPVEKSHSRHTYYLYVVRSKRRDALKRHLERLGIASGVHYPIPVHRMPYIGKRVTLPATERVVDEILSLPMHPLLTQSEQEAVIKGVRDFFRG